jgi:UDP-glucose 4-epimerase
MKIFIIGGAGYIGSHMVKIAHEANYDVVTIDNLSTGHKDAVLHGEFELCDILDSARLDKLFKKHKPEAVMHFSAYSIVGESVSNPYKYYNNNVSGTLSLLNAMINNSCMKFIFSSSAAIFGNPEYIPIDENHPKNPINPYGKTKLVVEEMLKDFESAYGLKYVSFRYFNAAGHDPEGELSERHNPETHLLPIIMQAVNGQRDSISIYGNDYDTNDGTCVRDYIHVNDLANTHLKGLDYLNLEGLPSTEFNLGNGNGFSVYEVVQQVKNITGKNFIVKEEGRRDGDPSVLIASDKKAKKILKSKISFPSLEKIIRTLYKEEV